MNRVFDLKMMIKATLIVILSLAIVFASGCRKKQPDKSAKTTQAPVSKKQKTPERDASMAKHTPVVEANNQNVPVLSDTALQKTVTAPDANQEYAVAPSDMAADTNNSAISAAQGQTETVAALPENPVTAEQLPSAQPEETIPSRPLKLDSFGEINDIVEKIKFISDFAAASPALLPELIDMALDDESPAVRAAAMEELSKKGFYHPDILPIVEKAIVDPDPAVRKSAIAACEHINDPAASDIMGIGMEDENEDVRAAAIKLLTDQKDPAIRLPVLEEGITSPHADIRAATLTEAMHTRSPKAVPILLEGLRDPDPDLRYTAASILEDIFGQKFESYEQGTKYWNENIQTYDDNLKLKVVTPTAPASPNNPGN
jgi:HEAT repeat protein